MRNIKKFAALALVLAISLTVPAFAAVEDTGFSDVDANAWYAEAVMYCREHNLMAGTGNNQFAPESNLTCAQLATVLYRIEGTPAVTGTDAFTDTPDGAWYGDAVLWASQQGLISGYGAGLFGTNDPVTREQMTAIFWRYADTQITTGKVRFSYNNLFTPRAAQEGAQEKYSTTLLIPKSDKATIKKIKAAYMQKHSGKKLPSNLKSTLHDGDGERPNGGEFGPECKGCYVITVSSNNKPVLVYADKTPITEPTELYSGCYGCAIINFYVYDTNGNKGISAGLDGIMKLEDGEPLAGGVVTDSDWDDNWEDEDGDDDLLG